MAYLIATADGNFTAAATWGAVDATSLLDAENGVTTLTTSFVESQTFTPGAIIVDGVAVRVAGRATTPTGTMLLRLAQGGVLVTGTDVTINVSDIPRGNALATDTGNGWIFFKFAAPVTLLAATAYTLSLRTTSASQVVVYRNATAANYSRMLRTTTTAAPGAGDNFHILGEWTAAATKTNRTVTMQNTATTDFGGASTTIPSFTIGVGGTLTWGTTAATNYILRLSGLLLIATGGTMTIGTTGTPMPRDSSGELQFDSASDGDFGFICWGTLTLQGLSRSSGKNIVQCLLNTDEAAAQTVLGVDTDTGWLNGDEIGIASTSRTGTEAETATLNGNAGATSMTVSAGIGAAHSGTSPNQAEVVLLTRNVRFTAVTTTAVWYGQIQVGAVLDWDWAGFRYFGQNTGTKLGAAVVLGTPTSFVVDFCLFRDSESDGIVFTGSGVGGTLVITDTIFYACPAASSGKTCLSVVTLSSAAIQATRCTTIFDVSGSNSWGFLLVSSNNCTGFIIDTCRVSSGVGYAASITATLGATIPKVFRDCVFHCLGTSAGLGPLSISPAATLVGLLIDTCQFRRCAITSSAAGVITISAGSSLILITDCQFVACANGVAMNTGADSVHFKNCTFAGDASFGQSQGILFTQGQAKWTNIRVENCSFGVGTAHTAADIEGSSISICYLELTLVNTVLSSATEFGTDLTTAANFFGKSFISQQRKDGNTGVHQTLYHRLGTVALDTVTFRTAGPSQKLTPTIGVMPATFNTFRLRSAVKRQPVASGKQLTFSVYVQKDASYNGSQPRLVLLSNPALGIDEDTVLDTLTVGSGTWEQLTGQMAANAEEAGVVEAVVECDGSAGNVYLDDWSRAST